MKRRSTDNQNDGEMPVAPTHFSGTLQELFDGYAAKILLSPNAVAEFHNQLSQYLKSGDPLFLVRQVAGMTRGETLRTQSGHRVQATDNAPSWWVHRQLWLGIDTDFGPFIESVPYHFFKVARFDTVNTADWHVAHLFSAKDGNTEFQEWDATNLTRRMVRSLHPCNYFYIPKSRWHQYGGAPEVLSFFYERLAVMYGDIWDEFLELAEAAPIAQREDARHFRYEITPKQAPRKTEPARQPPSETSARPPTKVVGQDQEKSDGAGDGLLVAQYEYSRFCFKADVIEPLGWNDRFRIITPTGTFEMSKREFYDVFRNVVDSRSYRDAGIYHQAKAPRKAMQFLVD